MPPVPASILGSKRGDAADNGQPSLAPYQRSSHPSHQMSPIGPPKIRPLPAKRPRRRAPRACDECRLRKRGCDAAQPCGPCRLSGIGCTYQFRRPVPHPTSRIRTLQDHLRQARTWLQQIKDKETIPGTPDVDLDECLRTLDFTLPDHTSPSPSSPVASQQSTSGGGHGSVVAMHDDMLKSHSRFLKKEAGVAYFYGAYSDVSFLLRTIELLETSPSASQNQRLGIISDLLSRPLRSLADPLEPGIAVHDVPENASALLDAVFSRGDLLSCFLIEQQLRDITSAVTVSPAAVPPHSVGLLHTVLALGYLYTSDDHGPDSSQDSLHKATRHLQIGISVGLPALAQDLTSLQTVLCAIIFLFSGYRTAMAHSLIGTASSLALRLGLFSSLHRHPEVISDDPDAKERIRLLAAVLSLDMLGSLILDLPPFIHHSLVPHTRLVELAMDAENRGDLYTAASLRQCVLLAIPLCLRHHAGEDQSTEDGNIRPLQNAHEACQRWKRDTTSLISRLGSQANSFQARRDLDMMYNLCQIILFRPHLHYIREMYAGKPVSVAESYYALACIRVSSSTITLAQEPRDQSSLSLTESWSTIYTIFSSVVCLVFLVAAHPATTLPSVAWQRACVGVRFIASNRRADNISTICLEILKMITHTLRQTIYIDFDKIEASTSPIIDAMDAKSTTGDTEAAKYVRSREQGLSLRQHNTSLLGEPGLSMSQGNEADKMLEQAEALPAEVTWDSLLYLSDTE